MRENFLLPPPPPPPSTECRICGAKAFVFDKLENMPIGGASVLLDKPSDVVCSDIVLYRCSSCGHIQIASIISDELHAIFASTNIETFMSYRKRSMAYLSSMSKEHKRVLEIGCGTGIMFNTVKKYFNNIVGVEPVKESVDRILMDDKIVVINDYFHKELPLGDSFDAFYSLEVFEHLDDPLKVLKDIYNTLKQDGVGWIEVPNGLTIINKAQYYNILPDHLNYYTPHSLSVLAYLAGFQTLHIRSSLNDDQLEIFIQKNKESYLSKERKEQIDFLINESLHYSNVVIWGAGAKAHTLFGMLNMRLRITHIVDTDSAKHGLYIPGTSKYIEFPVQSVFMDADLVIIFAVSYEAEIITALREQFLYTGKILTLSNN
jgi:SAM-dependent methyltransferase